MAKVDIRAFARKYAEGRMVELATEIESLRTVFPEIERPALMLPRLNGATPKVRKARKPMSAAAKKAVSLRMKSYWAGRRKKGTKAKTKTGGIKVGTEMHP